jgi:hypothetical protein
MLMIVIENPAQVTKVSDVPFVSMGAFCATIVENNGESAITTNPQKKRKQINKGKFIERANGDRKQHEPEKKSEIAATLFTPHFCDIIPAAIHARAPQPIIPKDNNGTFNAGS